MQIGKLATTVLITGLIAGTLDILAAIFILAGGEATRVFRFIASGAFGKAAFEGGSEMVAWGAFFHYLIAFSWTVLYFLICPLNSFFRRGKWLSAIVYGTVVWTVMNLFVVPSSQIGFRGVNLWNWIENWLILIVCIALPITISARRFYRTGSNEGNS
ncbi:MAG: hypothetical protein IT171_05485 [Acidobacteria bacterium]|nr:hypothetical protein [Acidobacteriota bacterium]